jgi:hypothetical protein
VSQEAMKKLKKGDILFKENDPCNSVFVVQTGRLALFVERGGKKVQIGTIGGYQVLGEQALITTGKHICGAEALQGTTLVELQADTLKSFFEKLPAGPRVLVRGLLEESKQARNLQRSQALEADKSPMPQMGIPRLFTLLHLIPRHVGKKEAANPDQSALLWSSLKTYAVRFFGESPQRLRSSLDLLKKLNCATFDVKLSEEEDEDLENLKISHLQQIEDFAEFYQFHLFKGPKAEMIYVDPLALRVAKAIVEFSEGAPVDHRGGSVVDYNLLITQVKTKYHLDLNNTHFDALERKGLFVTRRAMEGGNTVLTFDRAEFSKMAFFWSIIVEIDKWNAKGFVDLTEKELLVDDSKPKCGQCAGEINEAAKFCPNCGFKLSAAA